MFKRSPGFTLIEILLVISIIGILSVIGIQTFWSSQVKSRDLQRKNDLASIQRALELYYQDNNQYPLGDGNIEGCNDQQRCVWGGTWKSDSGTIYMIELPTDPKANNYYYRSVDGDSYAIYAMLENQNDKAYREAGYIGTSCDARGGLCNYGVASSNAYP